MTSEIRTNTLKNRVGLGTVSLTNTGAIVSGIVTTTGVDVNGDIDVDGHTNLDNVSIAGVSTFSGVIHAYETGDAKGIRIHSNGGISATNNELRFNTAQSSGFTFMTNSDGGSSNERLRIGSSGIVTQVETGTGNGMGGIKASTASGGGNAGFGFITGGTQRFALVTIGSAGSESLRVYDNNNSAERLRITSIGKVGIDNNSPDNKLSVYDVGYCGLELKSNRSTATDNIGGVHWKTQSTDVAYLQSLVDGTIRFRNTSSLTERLRITSAGRVQIGLTGMTGGDDQALTVNNPAGNANVLELSTSNSSGRINCSRTLSNTLNTTAYIEWNEPGAQGTGDLRFGTSASSNNPVERLRITSAGLVDIFGSASQSTYTPLLLQNSAAAGNGSNPDVVKLAFGSQGSVKASIRAAVYGEGHMAFHTNNDTEKVRITAAGVVNIGDVTNNTWIDSTLKVRKDQNAVTKISVRNENQGSSASSAIVVNAYGNSWMFDCGSAAKNSNALTIRVDATANSNQGYEKLRIKTNGNVGLGGETNPITTLSINTGDTGANTTYANAELIRIEGYGTTNSKSGIGFGRYNGGQNGYVPAAFIGAQTGTWSGHTNCHLVFATRNTTGNDNATERLRIRNDGIVQFNDNQGTYTNTVQSHSGEAGFITHYTARTTSGADLYRRMLDIASGGANPHGSSIRFLTSDDDTNPATCVERMRILNNGGVFIGNKSHNQRYPHIESPGLLTVQNGARVVASSGVYAAPKGGFCDHARYELEQKLINISNSALGLVQARNGQPLGINQSRDSWDRYSNLPNYLLGHAATDNINNTNFTLTLYANMTVFLLRTDGWNSVNLTGWNLIESDTQIEPAGSNTRLYVKSLAAGTYTNFDNDSAMYIFVL